MTEIDAAPMEEIAPVHPGEYLRDELMEPLGLSQNGLAHELGVLPARVNEIVLGKRSITADTALRLARYFDMSDAFFLRLQENYDLRVARRQLGSALAQITPLPRAS